jgi:outer membrane receptor protein involved in Fe transport
VPVAAINADTLVETNQLRLQDYYTQVPGLSVMAIGTQSTQVLSIRGINTGIAGNPSVGLTVDDVPYGASTNSGGGLLVPDFDPGDLAQVEVLRGPQGTLYGASSLGGLIKFVTRDPSFDELSGRVEAGTSSTYNGAKLGYNARASVNVPIGATFAIRASGFSREDPGYIDNPVQRVDGLNKDSVYGGHLSALWKPSADFSLKLSALWQKMKSDGSSDVDLQAGLGDLQQDYLPGIGGYERRFQAYSVTLSGNVGNIAMTAVTGYNINEYQDSWDASSIFGPVAQVAYNDPAVAGSPDFDSNRTTKFTQELRLAGSIGSHVDWLLGGFYTHEASSYVADYLAADTITGARVGDGVRIDFPTTYAELAGFVNVTVRVTDRFDVQLGGREGQIRQAFTQTETGPFVPLITGGLMPPVLTPETTARADAFTYLVTPRVRISPDLMVYVRLASGYRAGGVNGLVGGPNSNVPSQYDPDKTRNYEIGVKGDVLDHKLSFDGSVYYIDWKDIQTSEYANGYGYIANASGAKSEGVEISAEVRPVTGLKIAGWISWNSAVLTSAFPDTATVYGVSGNRLPYSARRSGNISIDEEFPLGGRLKGFVGGTLSYVGDRQGEFTSGPPTPPPRQLYPAYAKTDLHAGATYDAWRMSLFVNNLGDRRGVLAGGLGSFPASAFTYIQPRTVGVSFTRSF